ncbi:hypothetical protein Trydic_g13370 [Trypoxylus dichotomus]
MISGVGGILVMGLGIIISGVFILRVKPNARFVAAWIAFTAVIYAIGMGILMFIGCPMDELQGYGKFQPVCNSTINCNCDANKFAPICGQDGKTYYSACHAGCRNYTEKDGKIMEYLDLGSMLLILRCVDPRDKAMALGLIQFAIGLFDWKMVKDERGACKLYDSSIFRMFYHGTTGAILLCAFFVDVIVWYKAGSINFVDEQAPLEEELPAIASKPRNENCQ